MNSITNSDYVVSYAQNREDVLLSGFLRDIDKGFYVDVGANHPINDSVTNLFYKQGWRGINIEPIQSLHALLEVARPRDINLNIGIGERKGVKNLRHYKTKDGLSTFSKEMKNSYSDIDDMEYVDQKIRVETLGDVLSKYAPENIHFMKIDVEGFEYEVLKGNDWKKFRPWIICIEANHVIHEWKDIFEKNKYTQVFFDGLNNYYVADEHSDIARNFSYPETILARPILPPNTEAAFIKERKDKEMAIRDLDRARAGWEQLNAKVVQLEDELRRSRRLKGSVKQLLRAIDNVIAVRIENLNKAPKISHADIDMSGVSSAADALHRIRQYDFEKYYSTRSNQKLSYKVAHNIHYVLTKQPLRAYRKLRIKVKDTRS